MSSVISATGDNSSLVRNYHKNTADSDRALERLSTGKRINRPSDDPSGFVTAEGLRSEIVRLESELKSVNNNRLATRTQQSGLGRIEDELIALKGALVGSASGVLTDAEREAYDQQISTVLQDVGRLREQLAGAAAKLGNPAGTSPQPRIVIDKNDAAGAAAAIDARIDSVSISQAGQAAYEKYNLDVRERLAQDELVIHREALSQVEDADFAAEASNFAVSQTLAKGSLAAIAFNDRLGADQMTEILKSVQDNGAAARDAAAS